MSVPPPRWNEEELEVARRVAITKFREERLQEPLEQYLEQLRVAVALREREGAALHAYLAR